MTPAQSLARATSYLDEATENLTFEAFDWAFEEAWRGVAWILHALAGAPVALELGPIGHLPAAGTLSSPLHALPHPPRTARVALALERLRDQPRSPRQVEQIVFDAWDLHDVCGERLGLADDRLGTRLMLAEASPGRVGSAVVPRRTALKLIAAGSVFPLAACAKVDRDNPAPARSTPPAPAAASSPPVAVPAAQVKAVSPLGGGLWRTSDPFLFCAHHLDDYPAGNEKFGPAASLEGRELGRDFVGKDNWRMYHGRTVPGFPRHPHRGFETVTFVRTGLLDHSDSMGATARYGDGDVQWLTAGGGIQHAEMFPLARTDAPNPLHLYQIWLNLPASDKMVDPHFAMLWKEKIPRVTERDADGRATELTLAAGGYKDHAPPSPPPNSWASRTTSDVAIWTVRMDPGARFVLPAVRPGTLRSLYLHKGATTRAGERDVPPEHRVEVMDHGPLTLVAGAQETEFLLLQGRPIGEPVAKRGPFVMNTQAEIQQAYRDYQATQFGGWPWPVGDPVHRRGTTRFAKHIDGRFEEPT